MLRHSFHSGERSECRIRVLPSLLALEQQAPHERQERHGFHGSSHRQQALERKLLRDEQQALRGQLESHDIHDEQDVQRQLASCDRRLYVHLLPSIQALNETEQLYGVQLCDKHHVRRELRQVFRGVHNNQECGALRPTLHLKVSILHDALLIQQWGVACRKSHGGQDQGLYGQYHTQSCGYSRQDVR